MVFEKKRLNGGLRGSHIETYTDYSFFLFFLLAKIRWTILAAWKIKHFHEKFLALTWRFKKKKRWPSIETEQTNILLQEIYVNSLKWRFVFYKLDFQIRLTGSFPVKHETKTNLNYFYCITPKSESLKKSIQKFQIWILQLCNISLLYFRENNNITIAHTHKR